jgi:hypothetical protein
MSSPFAAPVASSSTFATPEAIFASGRATLFAAFHKFEKKPPDSRLPAAEARPRRRYVTSVPSRGTVRELSAESYVIQKIL